jgi:hypothetical protein
MRTNLEMRRLSHTKTTCGMRRGVEGDTRQRVTLYACGRPKGEKNGSFSLIERVILSAGAVLIFSISVQSGPMP